MPWPDDCNNDDPSVGECPSPCAGGEWGSLTDYIDNPKDAIHVCPKDDCPDWTDGGERGDIAGPYRSITDGLQATESRTIGKVVVLWPGTHAYNFSLSETLSNDGLVVWGCGSDEVTVEAANTDEPTLKVHGDMTATVHGLTLAGGRRGVEAWKGANLDLEDVAIVDPTRVGVLVLDAESSVSLTGGRIDNPHPECDRFGYGAMVKAGTLELEDVAVTGATTVGLLAHQSAHLKLTRVTVENVNTGWAGYGRGVHLQEFSTADFTEVSIQNTHDAGLFALRCPGLIDVEALSVDGITAGLAGGGVPTGDGIVIASGGAYDPSSFSLTSLRGADVRGASRAGIVLDGMRVQLDDNAAGSDNGYIVGDESYFVQGGTVIEKASSDDPHDLEATGTPLEFELEPVPIDDLAEVCP